MIRPALEAALVVARSAPGGAAEPPRALRPYLGFAKLPAAALQAIARALEEDEPFRRRVAAAVTEEEVGRPGWLWLTRPEGWAEEVVAAQEAADASAAEEAAAREERSAQRKLTAAHEVIDKVRAEAEQLRNQLARLQEDVAAERSRRAAAEAEAGEVNAALAERTTERDQAVRDLKHLEERHARQDDELQRLQETIDELVAEQSVDVGEPPPAPAPGVIDVADVVGTVVGALEQAADGIRTVAESLDHLGSSLTSRTEALTAGSTPPAEGAAGSPSRAGSGSDAAHGTEPGPGDGSVPGRSPDRPGPHGPQHPASGGSDTGRPPVRRVPARLPGGVLDDSTEAADHLIGLPDAVVLVDGYNVSMAGWPDEPVADQRARLVRGLDGLAARRGALFEVVFDGAEVVPLGPVPRTTSRDVHVRFSAPDEEADDVLLEMVGQLPASQTVVVASSDNRVRSGARRQGANVLHSRQLLALLD